jgi:predicted dienelactone hydrolase
MPWTNQHYKNFPPQGEAVVESIAPVLQENPPEIREALEPDACEHQPATASRKLLHKGIALCQWLKTWRDAYAISQRDRRKWVVTRWRVKKRSKALLKQVFQLLLTLNPLQVYRLFRTPMGEEVLSRLSHLMQYSSDRPSQDDSQPTNKPPPKLFERLSASLPWNAEQWRVAVEQFEQLLQMTEAMVEEISHLAATEARQDPPLDFSKMPDIRHPGEWGVTRQEIALYDERRDRHFWSLLYTPERWRTEKTPVAIMSHGLGASPIDFQDYAEHLTSHGYVVAVPQHPGSDATQIQSVLAGQSQDVFQLQEFLDRPLDISYLLDDLERRNQTEYQGRLNLERVGAIGHSFGGYTVLALAGAELNFDRLEQACGPILEVPNLSLLLQCRVLQLPRQAYNFRDGRVKAVLPVDPLGSEVFGAQGLQQVTIPVLLMAGSEDRTTPIVLEQLRIFPWLNSTQRHLALIKGKSHFGTFSKLETKLKAMLLKAFPHSTGADATVFYHYAYALSLAFFEVHLVQNLTYLPYLRASYAAYISQAPFDFYLISAASAQTLAQKLHDWETAYQSAQLP